MGPAQSYVANSAATPHSCRRLCKTGRLSPLLPWKRSVSWQVVGILIEAIRKYREVYGVGLKEAKDAVEALQAGRLVSPSAPGLHSPEELTKAIEEVQRLLGNGNKIEAIKIYRENFDTSLARAKYAIEQIQAGQTFRPEAGFESPIVPAQQVPRGRSNKLLGIIITAAIILFVGSILAFALLQPGGPFTPHYYPAGKAIILPAGSKTQPDIAVWFYNSNADNRFIGLVRAESGKLGWKAAPLAGDGFVDGLAAGPDLIYAAAGTDLLAYRRSDGSLAWQVQMLDKLNYGNSTLLVTAVRVITNNVDQSIQAYNADNGSPMWSVRLTGYDRSLRLIGNSLAVIDYIDTDYHYGLILLDLLTGERQNVIVPTCTILRQISPPWIPILDLSMTHRRMHSSWFLNSPYGCVQRIDLATERSSGIKPVVKVLLLCRMVFNFSRTDFHPVFQ